MEKNIVTTINGVGVASAPNDLASFFLTLRTKGDTLEAAKKQLDERVSEVLGALSSKKMKLEIEVVANRQNFRLEHREGTEKYSAGFQSVATVSWVCDVDDKLDDVYQTALKFDAHMPRPLFSIKDRDALQVEALQKAKEHVNATLEKECVLLNVAPSKLKILNWNIGYSGQLSNGAATSANYYLSNSAMGLNGTSVALPVGGSPGTPAYQAVQKVGSIYQELLDYVPLEPGNVTVSVPVQVNYIWNDE